MTNVNAGAAPDPKPTTTKLRQSSSSCSSCPPKPEGWEERLKEKSIDWVIETDGFVGINLGAAKAFIKSVEAQAREEGAAERQAEIVGVLKNMIEEKYDIGDMYGRDVLRNVLAAIEGK